MVKDARNLPPAPSEGELHKTALHYLARFAATEVGVRRFLERRVQRWARTMTAVGIEADTSVPLAAARQVASELVLTGVVNDSVFATARAERLTRSGRSKRATALHLASKGVSAEVCAMVVPDMELAAAIIFSNRRRLGPFRSTLEDATLKKRELSALARAGFPRDIANVALHLSRAEAEDILLTVRRG